MEAVLLQYSSADQPISPYKSHIRTTTQKKGTNVTMNRSLISRPSENFGSLNIPHHHHHGIIQTPPPHPPRLFQSYPPFSVQQQPPLLPLPISKPQNFNSSHGVRGLSCPPPTNRKLNNNNRTRDSSTLLKPRKSKPQAATTSSPRKEEKLKPASVSPPKEGGTVLISSAAKPLGPDPKYLPMNVSKILTTATTTNINTFSSLKAVVKNEEVEFSGSMAFTISPPPPSSLPLPTFSLRPKLSCNAQAAGVDAGATDDLRRILRLR